MTSSESNEWYTPARYVDAARDVLGGIDLDPASCPAANETVRATWYFTATDDGLAQPWSGRVWMNPPYGRAQADFVAKLLGHYRAGDVTAAVVLVNAHATETEWFRPLWAFPLCFTDHRIDFVPGDPDREPSTATHGSVFAYLGPDPGAFAQRFAEIGNVATRASSDELAESNHGRATGARPHGHVRGQGPRVGRQGAR